MSSQAKYHDEETQPLTAAASRDAPRKSTDSLTSISTTSVVLEQLGGEAAAGSAEADGTGRATSDGASGAGGALSKAEFDLEDAAYMPPSKSSKKRRRRLCWIICAAVVGAWLIALAVFLLQPGGGLRRASAGGSRGGKRITLDQVLGGAFRERKHAISWIEGANGEDGLLLERNGGSGKGYLVVEDVRSSSKDREQEADMHDSRVLMKRGWFTAAGERVYPDDVWPSRDLNKVLCISNKESNWRHSYRGNYWIFDVATQTGQPLDPADPSTPIQLAVWSPRSDAIAFVRKNNLYLRKLDSPQVVPITTDGGPELFYGVPDWVYEEEVFSGNSAMWWADDGRYLAFLRTNETIVPEYPIRYFVSRPSGRRPPKGLENYPETRKIKYPKAGAPNPVVDLQFYDTAGGGGGGEVFTADIAGDFPDADRLITEVVWAGASGQLLVRETNRESDLLRVVLVDVRQRTGRAVRSVDVTAIDQGWFEVSQDTRYIPADASKGRAHDGYIDTVIHDGYDHLAYFSPLDNPQPVLLTSGAWEVVSAPSAVDLDNNLVYFVATKESPIQRHVYSVKLDGSGLAAMTDTSTEGYYEVSFSKGAGYALLSYSGPDVPWQKVISTPGNARNGNGNGDGSGGSGGGGNDSGAYVHVIEQNEALRALAAKHSMPTNVYSTVTIDGFTLHVVERRPPHFDASGRTKYPVLFHLYGGPGSQTVSKRWRVDFQAYVAASLGYLVVTVDGRGTGFIGRRARCIVRGNIGHYEATDQIETAKLWAQRAYVDAARMAIWGWSYGGFLTLKTLELDAGRTFRYGMAVAPVTDWKFYDSIYTERYMHTPQHNPDGYANASISDVRALAANVRFLLMHGVADDNVHLQNSLTLLDKLDLASVENYDVHIFPDSDHSIYFHNANRMVYGRLRNWLINAFNGEWLRVPHARPKALQALGDVEKRKKIK